jgi:hypothetical protein
VGAITVVLIGGALGSERRAGILEGKFWSQSGLTDAATSPLPQQHYPATPNVYSSEITITKSGLYEKRIHALSIESSRRGSMLARLRLDLVSMSPMYVEEPWKVSSGLISCCTCAHQSSENRLLRMGSLLIMVHLTAEERS